MSNLTSKDRFKLPTEAVFFPEQFENALAKSRQNLMPAASDHGISRCEGILENEKSLESFIVIFVNNLLKGFS